MTIKTVILLTSNKTSFKLLVARLLFLTFIAHVTNVSYVCQLVLCADTHFSEQSYIKFITYVYAFLKISIRNMTAKNIFGFAYLENFSITYAFFYIYLSTNCSVFILCFKWTRDDDAL